MLSISRFLLVLLLFLPVSACSDTGSEHDTASTTTEISVNESTTRPYVIKKVESREIVSEIKAVGTVRAYQEVEISSEVSGKIKKIFYDTGDFVKQGTLLAQIDNESRLIQVKKKKALLKRAMVSFKKADKDSKKGLSLYKQGVISDSQEDDFLLQREIAEAELELAQAELSQSERDLKNTMITAPFDGRIADKNIEVGQIVMPAQRLFTLVDISRVKIAVNISEMDVGKLRTGDISFVQLNSIPGKKFKGQVRSIAPKADDASRTFPVEVVVPNDQGYLIPGMVARLVIKSGRVEKKVIIPIQAVENHNGVKIVRVMKDGKIRQKIVNTGAEDSGDVVVLHGLNEGDLLVVPRDGASH